MMKNKIFKLWCVTSFVVLINSGLTLGFFDWNWWDSRDYSSLVKKSDIFWYNPNPREKPKTIRITQMASVPNKQEMKIIIHGYMAGRKHISVAPIKNAYLARSYNTVYLADWRKAACLYYSTSRKLIKKVARRLSEILDAFVKKHGINPKDIHIIGHSLGAHIAGLIGRHFQGQVGRITGLDPALPLFHHSSKDRLMVSDAMFVDVIHTDGKGYGEIKPRGHVDFYPNYGRYLQPGCVLWDIWTLTACSHYRAPLIYAETIQLPNNFPAVKCPYDKIIHCTVQDCFNTEDIVFMGESLEHNARGTYFLETNRVSPYGRGLYSNSKKKRV